MHKPLMPKATAVWLIDNTALSFNQIAEFCNLHILEIQAIADGEVGAGIVGFDPIKFDALQYETYRQHRGQINSAMIMRQMLDSSKLIGVAFGDASILDEDIFTHSPQMHGPVMETLAQAFKTLQLELNSTESGVLKNKASGLDASQTKIAAMNVRASLEIILISSMRRMSSMKKEYNKERKF